MLLDRDGVLNREPVEGWLTDPSAWGWEPGALEGLSRLSRSGVALSVVTNQSGIGRGSVDRAAVDAVHRRMLGDLAEVGVVLAGIHVCPHAPSDGCRCRKPRPGLLLDALAEVGTDPADALMVGDDRRDVDAGRIAGTSVALVRTGKGAGVAEQIVGVPVFDDLTALAKWLVDDGERRGPNAAAATK